MTTSMCQSLKCLLYYTCKTVTEISEGLTEKEGCH